MNGNSGSPPGSGPRRPFLGVHFVNCGMYGRMYKNKEGTAYVGHCPRCGSRINIRIDPQGGTNHRFFRYYCS
jgi:hypothetical protein